MKSSVLKVLMFCRHNTSDLKNKQVFKFLAIVLEKLLTLKQLRRQFRIDPV